MRILFIQLARLGDVLLTVPTVRAMKKKYPGAKIDLLVRKKFSGIAELFENEIDNIIRLDTAKVLGPLLSDPNGVEESLRQQQLFIDGLQGYDKVINFSYSPYSSYLTHAISANADVVGYSRFEDGSLNIVDDVSAYIFAQVGPGMSNRFHLSDLFASALELDLEPADRVVDSSEPKFQLRPEFQPQGDYLVLHVGASQSAKTYPVEKWRIVIARILKQWEGKVVLIGSREERSRAEAIQKGFQGSSIIDLVGKTHINELFGLISRARLVLGADSVPIHIASMVNTPVVNLSFATVNFWETGPLSDNSRVLFAPTPAELMSDQVSLEALSVLRNDTATGAFALFRPGQPCFGLTTVGFQQFEWELTRALYTGEQFPQIDEMVIYHAFERLAEANQIIIEQLEKLESGVDPQMIMPLIERSEELIGSIKQLVMPIAPLVNWLQTEKSRIGPIELEHVIQDYLRIHRSLDEVARYFVEVDNPEEGKSDTESVFE